MHHSFWALAIPILLQITPTETGFTLPMEIGALGHPIVRVKLSSRDGTLKEGRFILDTGASHTVLDRAFPSQFWVPDNADALGTDSIGETMEARVVKLHRLQLGPLDLQTEALLLNIKDTIGRWDDQPVDGVLGMNTFKGHRIQLDFQAGVVRWNGAITVEPGLKRPIRYTDTGSPVLELRVAGRKLKAICDTGSNLFLEIPPNDTKHLLLSTDPSGVGYGLSGAGKNFQDTLSTVSVEVAGKAWCKQSLTVRDGIERPLLGVEAFGPSVWFDFKKDWVGFSVSTEGCLPAQPVLRTPMAVFWDRKEGKPQLTVLGLKPGTRFERAGIRPGDVILRAGSLQGATLGIRVLRECLTQEGALEFEVQRQGSMILIQVPEK